MSGIVRKWDAVKYIDRRLRIRERVGVVRRDAQRALTAYCSSRLRYAAC